MKELNNVQNWIFIIGGGLMTIGAGCYAFLLVQDVAAVVAFVGAVAFASMQMMQTYQGTSLTLRRLRKIMTFADILFIVAGLLMVEQQFGCVARLLADHPSWYVTFVSATYGKWVVVLLIAAVLELYTMHRISSELEKG
jgi:hypothetical protein